MRLFTALVTFLSALVLGTTALAQQPEADKDFKVVKPVQTTTSGKNVEVLEFFSYACPHCADFEPSLREWMRRQPKDVNVRPVPMVFRESWRPLAKLFYTMEVMGTLEKNHQKVFDAIHKQNAALSTDQAVIEWAAKQGMDKTKFEQTYNSMGIDNKVEHAIALGRGYGVQFTPAIGVNGKYWTGPSMVKGAGGGPDVGRFFAVVDALVAAERPAQPAAAPTKKK